MADPTRRVYVRPPDGLDEESGVRWMVDAILGQMTDWSDECQECGSPMAPVMYGLPTPAGLEASARGEFVLGGCQERAISRACVECNWPLEDHSEDDL